MKTKISIRERSLYFETDELEVNIILKETTDPIEQTIKRHPDLENVFEIKKEDFKETPVTDLPEKTEDDKRQCHVCGKHFKPKTKISKYCSTRCANIEYHKRHYAKKAKKTAAPNKQAETPEQTSKPVAADSVHISTSKKRICQQCGTEFEAQGNKQIHCSPECKAESKKAKPGMYDGSVSAVTGWRKD